MPELGPFPPSNLNPSASPWGRKVEDAFKRLNRLLDTVDQRSQSTAKAVVSAGADVEAADGRIYRPNGVVVPAVGQQLLWSYGEDADGNTTQRVIGREDNTPYTIFYGDSEADDLGWYAAMQLDPFQAALRSNGLAYGGRSAILTMQGGADPDNSQGYTGYLYSPPIFAVEFGTTQNVSVDPSNANVFDPTANRWAIRYQAADDEPLSEGGRPGLLSMVDGRFEVATFNHDGQGGGADYGFRFKDWMLAYAETNGNGDVERHLVLQDGVILDGWGTGGSGGGSVPDASPTTKGIIELATQAEVDAGTDSVRAVTPATMASYVASHAGSGGGGTPFNLADAWKGEWVAP